MAASVYLVENNRAWDPYQRTAQLEVENRQSLLDSQISFLLAKYFALSFGSRGPGFDTEYWLQYRLFENIHI